LNKLSESKCIPCEGNIPPLTIQESQNFLKEIPKWNLSEDGKKIFRKFQMEHFRAGVEFLNEVKDIAEREGHHPDFHLTNYRNVTIELYTHAIGGLSVNDIILASKINELKPKLKDW